MTVTVVSAQPQSTQAATVDAPSSGDSIDSGIDFASLLLGQLLPTMPPVLPETKTETTSNSPDDTPVDAASILATLIPPSEPGRRVDDAIDSSAGQGASISAVDATGQLKPALPAAQQTVERTPQAQQSAEPVMLNAAASDDKPAKLAAVSLVSTASTPPSTKAPSSDDAPSLSSLTMSHAFPHSNHVPANRDAPLTVNTSFRDQNWSTDFSQKIVWLASNDKQSAQLTLNPPQMGPIEISITVDKGNATASFASANSDVREAIETALPRLREMFANAGIQLGQTNVGAESFQQQANSGASYGASRGMSDNAILAADSAGSLSARAFAAKQGNGMVDIFA